MTSDQSNSREAFDFVVVGGGLAGYSAALRAAGHGMKTALVDTREAGIGGSFVHDLALPIALMRRSACVLRTARHAAEFAVELAEEPRADMSGLQRRKQILVAQVEQSMRDALEKQRVTLLAGRGFLMAVDTVAVLDSRTGDETMLLESRSIVLAVGSRAASSDCVRVDGTAVLEPEQLLRQRRPVRSLVIIGDGAVACELASVYREFGAEVTMVSTSGDVLPWADAEISDALRSSLEKRGIRVAMHADVLSVESSESGCRTMMREAGTDSTLASDLVVNAAPRLPSTENLGLTKLGIELMSGEGWIRVDGNCMTSCPGVYAIGSCACGSSSTPAMDLAQGWFVADHAAGKSPRIPQASRLPRTAETEPPVAAVGITEAQARASGCRVAVGRSEFRGLAQSVLCSETAGFVKVVTDADTGEILGAHIIGPGAGELIAQFQLASEFEYTAFDFPEALGPVRSLGGAVSESVRDARKSSSGL